VSGMPTTLGRSSWAPFAERSRTLQSITDLRSLKTMRAPLSVRLRGDLRRSAWSIIGDSVTLVVPERAFPLRGGGALQIVAGNLVTIEKADLVLEELT